jgi:hypothetical protein
MNAHLCLEIKMDTIKITDTLHDFFIKERNGRATKEGITFLYLGGSTKKGVCTDAVRLNYKRGFGCSFMPGINKHVVTSAAIRLYKQKLIPSCFILVSMNMTETSWSGDSGSAIYFHKNMPFISYLNDNTMAEVNDGNKIELLEIGVVKSTRKNLYCICQK